MLAGVDDIADEFFQDVFECGDPHHIPVLGVDDAGHVCAVVAHACHSVQE